MITVLYTNPNMADHVVRSLDWCFDSKKSLRDSFFGSDLLNIRSVEADGQELELILLQFTNIPKLNSNLTHRSLTWFGDDAKFIVANLI